MFILLKFSILKSLLFSNRYNQKETISIVMFIIMIYLNAM